MNNRESDLPEAPEGLPKYLSEGLPKQDLPTLRNTVEWLEELIEIYEQPVDPEEISREEGVEEVEETGGGCKVTKYVQCGDDSCHCSTSGSQGHGPYAYEITRENGEQKWTYLGKASE